ncbi:MAG: ribbon-helix-helix protein, CopG family [Actinophytocola sp.]|nr:ribbon-helix-helix protein, CopG family [Actinophytocola sp.]
MPRYEIGPDIDLDAEDVRDSAGERITEARAEEIAEQALRKVHAGRPSLSGGRTHSPQVSFRVPKQLHARAAEVAEREGKSVSQLGREALEEYLSSR